MFKLTRKTPQWRPKFFKQLTFLKNVSFPKTFERNSGVFIVNFEHTSHLFLAFLLSNLHKKMLTGLPEPEA